MNRNIWLFLFFACCVLFISCRKGVGRTRAHRTTRVQIEKNQEEPKLECSKESKISEHHKKSKHPLSGSEIFRRYGNAVFMVFTSDGISNYQGSGFFVGENGLAVSNYHVFKGTTKGQENIKIANENNALYKLNDVVYKSKEQDFIIFHVDYENSCYIPIANRRPAIGDKVFAIGSPRGLENTFSSGEISQWRGDYLMQISALIDHGSSGGALINEYGEAVGITSGSFADGSQANLNYAWSIDVIKPYIK